MIFGNGGGEGAKVKVHTSSLQDITPTYVFILFFYISNKFMLSYDLSYVMIELTLYSLDITIK